MNENARIQWFKILPSATPTKSGSTGVPLDRAEESPYSYASFSFDTLSFQKEAGGDPSVAFFSSTRLVSRFLKRHISNLTHMSNVTNRDTVIRNYAIPLTLYYRNG